MSSFCICFPSFNRKNNSLSSAFSLSLLALASASLRTLPSASLLAMSSATALALATALASASATALALASASALALAKATDMASALALASASACFTFSFLNLSCSSCNLALLIFSISFSVKGKGSAFLNISSTSFNDKAPLLSSTSPRRLSKLILCCLAYSLSTENLGYLFVLSVKSKNFCLINRVTCSLSIGVSLGFLTFGFGTNVSLAFFTACLEDCASSSVMASCFLKASCLSFIAFLSASACASASIVF